MNQLINPGLDIIPIKHDTRALRVLEVIPELYPNSKEKLNKDFERALSRLKYWCSTRTEEELITECQKPDEMGNWPVRDKGDGTFTLYIGSSCAPDLDTCLHFKVKSSV